MVMVPPRLRRNDCVKCKGWNTDTHRVQNAKMHGDDMTRWNFMIVVALTFAGALAWSTWMVAPLAGLPTAWREMPSRTHAADTANAPSLAWGRHDATLDAILTGAVWKASAPRHKTHSRALDEI